MLEFLYTKDYDVTKRDESSSPVSEPDGFPGNKSYAGNGGSLIDLDSFTDG